MEPKTFWDAVTTPLTPAQKQAIAHVDGPLLVLAGPGSGKTTVITYRVAYLTKVTGLDPRSLLIVTFTKAAADSMKRRCMGTAGPAAATQALFGTFHALAYRILRQAAPHREIKILDESDQLRLIRQLMRQHGLNTDDDTVIQTVSAISRMRAALGAPRQALPAGVTQSDLAGIWVGYQDAKARRGLHDFDDLLHEALEALRSGAPLLETLRRRFTHVMVDECQDTNPVQWELIRLLAAPRHNLTVVGDDDQSIYGWRGAGPQFLLEFPKLFPQAVTVALDVNHRCPPPVVEAANRLVAHNRLRFAKTVTSARPNGPHVKLLSPTDTLEEAGQIADLIRQTPGPLSDWAVVYRTNQQAHVIAQVLTREGIPFRAVGGLPNPYKRWALQDILSYLKAAVGQDGAIEQVINRPNRYVARSVLQEAKGLSQREGMDLLSAIGATGRLRSWQLRPVEELQDHLRRLRTLTAPAAIGYVRRMIGYDDYLQEYCSREGGSPDEMLGLLDEVERAAPSLLLTAFLAHVDSFGTWQAGSDEGEAVTLVTCHKAKGLEFRCVVVAGATDKLMPHRGADDQEEERRLMYVAMTRAAERLWLSSPRQYEGREAGPSPFIAEAMGLAAGKELQGGPSGATRGHRRSGAAAN